MRWAVLVALLTVPVALVAWVRWAAVHDAPPEYVPPKAAPVEDPAPGLRALFQGGLGGLAAAGEGALYDEKSLFEAINGAAPVYLERKFRRMLSMELKTEKGSDVTCDVYDMTDAEHARSIFEKERSAQAKPPEGWPEALVGSMSLVFHAGRFYVKATAFDADGEAALLPLGRALKEKVR